MSPDTFHQAAMTAALEATHEALTREDVYAHAGMHFAEQSLAMQRALVDAGRTIHGTHSDMLRYRGQPWDRCPHPLCRVHQRRVAEACVGEPSVPERVRAPDLVEQLVESLMCREGEALTREVAEERANNIACGLMGVEVTP